jgi:hypothetical protein
VKPAAAAALPRGVRGAVVAVTSGVAVVDLRDAPNPSDLVDHARADEQQPRI